MNGRAFFKILTKRGIPCSALAQKTQTQLSHLYGLKHASTVPNHYLRAVVTHYRDQLTIDDLACLSLYSSSEILKVA
ncbi:hypothetical protein [Ferrimonas sp. YFM]|uniref:hypothetical protein n=1 Tax=Ferrimonas sp. YFM TaxID=3028878 RepID=UPI0025723ED9|nr:hypothetical protein [Ferrimonas sp. YFM]BDY04119.1 hypothetical protein F0521_11600 [Ferrimonas sp. YFM]